MKSIRIFCLLVGSLLLGSYVACPQETKKLYSIVSPGTVAPLGDGLSPEKRKELFFETITQTLRQMPPEAQKDLMMVGTGSWMSTDPNKRAGANDIDATISYLHNDHSIAQAFQQKFEENLKKKGLNPPPDITLFVDEKDEGKQDFYRGPTGNFFFFTHSRNNNPLSLLDLALGEDGLRVRPEKVEAFWTRRNKEVPAKIAQAHLFVQDNQAFLLHKYNDEKDLVKKALTIAKYADRVEVMLKKEILQQWGKRIDAPDYLAPFIRKVNCLKGYAHILETSQPSKPEDRQRVMDCLGAKNEAELQQRVAELLQQSDQYFKETEKQVEEAENSAVLPSDEVPDDIVKNTGAVKVDRYFVFLLTNSSNGLYVGSEESLKGRTRCSFVGGGINCKASDVVTYKKLHGPFASQAEAQAALCQSITETRYFPIGVGLKGRWQGGNTWYGLWDASVSDCPR